MNMVIVNGVNITEDNERLKKELNELKRDVARYFELWGQAKSKWGNGIDDIESNEFTMLHIKLSKVGKQE